MVYELKIKKLRNYTIHASQEGVGAIYYIYNIYYIYTMFIHGYDGVNKNKHSVYIISDLTWQYDGPKDDINTRPERVYNAALRDIANLLEDITSGDKGFWGILEPRRLETEGRGVCF